MSAIKVSEFARATGYSRENVYHWIRVGVIPRSCVKRIGSTIRLDGDECMRLLQAGKLARPRTRRVPENALEAEDSHTTRRGRINDSSDRQHRFVDESGRVDPEHPYSLTMIQKER
jgi:hypothetical protein